MRKTLPALLLWSVLLGFSPTSADGQPLPEGVLERRPASGGQEVPDPISVMQPARDQQGPDALTERQTGSLSRQLFALVVGCNTTHDAGVPRLRFADDDAMQNAELLGQLGAEVVLLVAPDRESSALHPEVAKAPATKAAVSEAMAELNRRMQAARGRGQTPILYFFYSGHGDIKNNQGQVTLEDSFLTRNEFLELLRSSTAVVNHVVVDACKSYFFLFERGSGGERARLRADLADDAGALPPNTGILLSTSAAADSHEWEAYQGGVFSHELRSALRGAADVNGDRLVSYEEAAAFIWTANLAIPSRRYRPSFFFRPAARVDGSTMVLADLRPARGDYLLVEAAEAAARAFVEDAQGTRLVDFHLGASQSVNLLLPSRRPLFLRWPDAGREVEIPSGTPIEVASLHPRSTGTWVRGAEHIAFGRLFSLPFGRQALAAFRSRPVEEDEPSPSAIPKDWNWVRHGLGVTAVVAGAAGGVLSALALGARNGIESSASGLERDSVNHQIDDINVAAVTCYLIAGATAAGYLTWTLWPKRGSGIQVQPPLAAASGVKVGMEW